MTVNFERGNVCAGDTLVVMITHDGRITVDRDEMSHTIRMDVVGILQTSFIVWVPSYVHISHAVPLSGRLREQANIDPKWVGEHIVAVPDTAIVRVIINTDGMHCARCGQWYDFAVPNQPDYRTMICFACRENQYRGHLKVVLDDDDN